MKALPFALGLAVLPLTAPAQEPPASPDAGQMDEGLSLLEQGAQLFLRGLIEQVQPQMQEMQKGLDDFGTRMGSALDQAQPWITALSGLVDDFAYYDAPQRLANGDILIRRKPDAPPVVLESLPPAPQTDL